MQAKVHQIVVNRRFFSLLLPVFCPLLLFIRHPFDRRQDTKDPLLGMKELREGFPSVPPVAPAETVCLNRTLFARAAEVIGSRGIK